MGSFSVVGLDGLIDDFAELARLPGSVVDGILEAEADVILPAQREEIERRWNGPYSEGISAKCVKKGKVKKNRDGRSLSIYPQGTRRRGKSKKSTRNAEIAFINEYGAPWRGIEARPAIGTANAKKEQEAVEAGERVYHAYLDSKNL